MTPRGRSMRITSATGVIDEGLLNGNCTTLSAHGLSGPPVSCEVIIRHLAERRQCRIYRRGATKDTPTG